MIQRIQSIFLFLVSILMGVTIFLPLWGKSDGTNRIEIDTMHMVELSSGEVVSEQTTVYLAIIAGLTALLALWNVFNFKNRRFQMKIGLFCTLLIAVFIAVEVFLTFQGQAAFAPEVGGNFAYGFFLPVGAILLNWMAIRAIKRDEDMVRSADRLR
ncbi:DUF4293 domain-containing protein [Bernardetia sp.]|uniref:DUF4293 domain-containing protein n=1 Tax=Bernardetia sp. TaxID=1937974 RepID=UPI0025BCFBE7|nr:DUF4293 domain-containing protein [Bernardetia sp.]